MIYKRFAANLRAQNWTAIAIEVGIVVVGVFIGTWVANWNQERVERAETRRMIAQLEPSLDYLEQYFESARRYYGVTRRYAPRSPAGRAIPGSATAISSSPPTRPARSSASAPTARPGQACSAPIACARSTTRS